MSFDNLSSGWAKVLGVDRKQFNMFFERMMDGFAYHKIVVDAAGKPVDYVFLEVNNAFERLTGLKRESIVGKKATEILPGIKKDPADWINVYGRVAITCEPVQFENYAAPLDRWYRVNAYCPAKGYFVSLFEDITERKKAEEKVAQQSFMIENVNDAIIGYNYEQRVTFWNKGAEKLYGYKSDEALGKVGSDLLKPAYPTVTREQLVKKIADEGHFEAESVRKTKSGKDINVEANTILLLDEVGKPVGYVSVDRDITERKKVENALRKSEEEYRTLFTNMMDGFAHCKMLYDEKGDPEDFIYLQVNDAFEAITGIKRELVVGRKVTEAIPGIKEANPELFTIYGKVAKTGKHERFEVFFKPLDMWLSISVYSPERGFFAAIFENITDRKNAEEVLSKQAALIDLSPEAIIVKKIDGTITLWSHGAETLYGWSKEEAMDRTTNSLLKPEFPMPLNEIMVQVSSRGYWSGEITHKTKDARRLCVRSHWLGRFDKNKEKLLEILETNVDITEQKQMQEKLEEYARNLESLVEERTKEVTTERERLYQVLETIPAYVVLLDKGYRVPFANRVFRDLFGESNGRCCYDFLFHRNSPCELCETYKVLRTGKPHRWEWTGPNGRNYDIYDFPFKTNDGSMQILEMGVDITERKKAEAAVQTERKRFFDVLETMPQMICLLTPDYHVKFANRAFRERFGESHGRHCYEYRFGRKKPCSFCESYEVIRTGKPHHWEVTGEDGSVIETYDFPFIDADGSTLVLEVNTDVTEQKRAAKQLRDASLYSRSLLEASLDPLVTISAEGKVTDVNDATIKATGCSREELVGSDFCDYFTQPAKARAGYRKVFAKGHIRDYPLAIRHKSGRVMDVLYNAAVYRNEAGKIQGVFAAARDVTDLNKYREHLEELVVERTRALKESQDKLELKAAEVEEYATNMEALAEERAIKLKDVERLAAIGATAGMVGHDIRNPLQAIVGDIFLAEGDVESLPSSEVKASLSESLNSIQKSVDYVNKIVQDLQDYAKPLKPVICDTDLQGVIEEILKKNSIPTNIRLIRRIGEDTLIIRVDPDLLRRILGNLFSNAIQAMPDGGKLTIQTRRKNHNVILSVKDTGQGIPEHSRANLFTPLFTTKSKGQGFGLAVVKRMTEALGGTVTFESEEGKGAEFIVRLPQ